MKSAPRASAFVSPTLEVCVAPSATRRNAVFASLTMASAVVMGRVRSALFSGLGLAFVLVFQGVLQNFANYVVAHTLTGGTQTIAQGPVASQVAIKMFGTNGGGFFNANSAHPFENPSALTNLVQIVLIFSLGAARLTERVYEERFVNRA